MHHADEIRFDAPAMRPISGVSQKVTGERMKTSFKRWAIAASMLAALVGCGSDNTTAPPPDVIPPPVVVPPPVEVPSGTSPVNASALPPSAFAALAPVVKVGKVDVTSTATTVYFSMATTAGDNPITGFGSTSKSTTATVASYPNLAFALAKLVPSVSGSPSKWVSYIVTTVPTTTTAAAPTRPSTDNTGTLVDNKNGTYAYTFYRNITAIKSQVAGMTVTAPNATVDLGDLTYDASLAHRLTIQVSGNAPGTGTNTPTGVQVTPGVAMTNPVNVIYNFIPATGAAITSAQAGREMVTTANCNTCHVKLGGIPGLSSDADSAQFHGGSRNDVEYCVVCHTDQRKYGRVEAIYDSTNTFTSASTNTYRLYDNGIGNLPQLIHKAHLGGVLAMKNYNYGGVVFNETTYPQDIRNCTKCHDGSMTAQGNNWMTTPNKVACGACHDGINFTTGKGVRLADAAKGLTATTIFPPGGYAHPPGPLADDSTCLTCHKDGGPAPVNKVHLPVTPPSSSNALFPAPFTGFADPPVGYNTVGTNANTNAAWIASNQNRLPAGAIKISYDIKSVSRSATTGRPVMVFCLQQNGVCKNLNSFATSTPNPATGQKEIWDNFMGAPSLYFVFAVPQDGIAAPADFNASVSVYLRSLWNGAATGAKAGTLTGPDASGYYTATITGTLIPANAVMLTGGVGYSYNNKTSLPLTQTNLPDYPTSPSSASGLTREMPNAAGGLIVIAPNKQVVANGYTGRRPIVADAKCNACHQELGAFTEDAFHAGQRNDGTTCSWCHNPNTAGSGSGWSADSTAFVHAIHASAKRTEKYTWHAVSATEGFWDVTYPGILNECEVCHLPGTYDFSASTSAAAAPNRPFRYAATGTVSAAGTVSNSPYVVGGTNYGSAPSYGASTGVVAQGASTNLVISPTTAVCTACHDSPLALSHISSMNGSFYAPRGTSTTSAGVAETCELCHNPGGVADIKTVHATK
jgi:OmcA/MtrC family decaheme c-type cytochrome